MSIFTFTIFKFQRKAIIHSRNSYGGYYLRWIDAGWGTKDKMGHISNALWYNDHLYHI